MDVLPYYILIGVGVGFIVILFLQNFRMAVEYLLTVGKVALVLFLILLLGWLVGLWDLPRPVALLLFGLRRLWRPFQLDLLRWIRGHLR